MQSKKCFIGWRATLAILTVTLLMKGRGAAAQERVLHSFVFDGKDGNAPVASLIFDSAGNLYGTTSSGGAYNSGTAFKLTPRTTHVWMEKVLHSFNSGGFAEGPSAELVLDASGNLYGTTLGGGTYGDGTAFELLPPTTGGWIERILRNFGVGGVDPEAGFIFDSAGNLYSTNSKGGAYGDGSVFELTPRTGGGWTESILYSFVDNGTDGYFPAAGVIFDAAGNLYGTTAHGGVYTVGTVFELKPTQSGGWSERILHSFNSNGSDGYSPAASLLLDAAGNLYGTTELGGAHSAGTVFELTPRTGGAWSERILHSFGNGSDGSLPYSALIFDAAGNLYGTTSRGGTYGNGIVFELTPRTGGAWSERILHSFGNGTDGSLPYAGLIFDTTGHLYGTTLEGGAFGEGTVFEITP